MQTTIKVRKETKAELDTFREHPNESYDQVLRKVMFVALRSDDDPRLSQETVRRIKKARKEIAQGKYLTNDELKKRLGL